ncbi:MAG TPA: serine/threonine-protein kinase, partial [Pyrinomonadaceae bacterium]
MPRIFFNEDSAQNTKAVNKRKYDDQTVPLALHSTPYYEKAGADSEITPRFYELGNILENRYRIINYLGQGGFGDIYAIENIDSYFSDIQVLKLVHSKIEKDFSVASPEALRDSYRSQYKAWKILSEKEPNFIVRLFDVQVIARRVGILMEWMEGGTLLEMVEAWGGKPQTQEQLQHLIKLFIQACRSLNIIHKHNLIHRDVKPQNFLLDAARQKCKLCDFELLNKEDEDIKEIFTEVFSSNTSNLIVGTLRYMSPESFDGKFSVKSDIFALGVTFYFLLSGEYPFSDGSEAVLSILNAAHRNEPARPLTELNSLVSPSLDRLVQWCLEFNPEQRPDSVADLINRLLQLGISDEESNFSPVNLARLLLNHLSPIDLEWLIDHLRKRGFRSMSELPEYQQQDMIEEYCYTTSPFEILKEHCGGASLYAIAEALKIKKEKLSRDDLIKEIVTTLGFLPGRKQAHGLESIRRALESSRIKIESA